IIRAGDNGGADTRLLDLVHGLLQLRLS
ncbi:MAG: hypothetical protein ACTMIG_06755, partial [Corynebacterium variabile]